MPAVKTCPLDPADLVARFRVAAATAGFREEIMGSCDGVPLLAFTRRCAGARPRIYLSAGVHGDEPAPPQALLHLLETQVFTNDANWFLVPMINPTGFRRGQRENADEVDLNRDYLSLHTAEIRAHQAWLARQPRFDLALCLHEDWESTGFYFYELARDGDPEPARRIRAAVARDMPIDPETTIDGRPIDEPGIIRPESDPALRDQWPEAIYLFAHHTDRCFTFESPSSLPPANRITALTTAVRTALSPLISP